MYVCDRGGGHGQFWGVSGDNGSICCIPYGVCYGLLPPAHHMASTDTHSRHASATKATSLEDHRSHSGKAWRALKSQLSPECGHLVRL